jgi:hypothetical protein
MGWRRTEELLAAGRDSGSVFLGRFALGAHDQG